MNERGYICHFLHTQLDTGIIRDFVYYSIERKSNLTNISNENTAKFNENRLIHLLAVLQLRKYSIFIGNSPTARRTIHSNFKMLGAHRTIVRMCTWHHDECCQSFIQANDTF